jgi:hypothetical protein
MRRWLVAVASLLAGGAVSAGLLITTNPARDTVEVWSAAHSVAAGSQLDAASVAPALVNTGLATSLLFKRGEVSQLIGLRASHDLAAGQLIQRSDVSASNAPADRRLVFVPIKNVPAAAPGSRVDLLVISGSPESPTVQTFAAGVEVSSVEAGGLVIVVSAPQAAAFVYAAVAMNLVAVVAEPGSTAGAELPVSGADEAAQIAGQP